MRSPVTQQIILADDNSKYRTLTREAISTYTSNLKITEFSTGDSFLEWAKLSTEVGPTLIMVDLNMPGRNGLEVVRELGLIDSFADIPVVIVSGTEDQEDLAAADDLAVMGFVPKQSDFFEFESMIHRILSQKIES